MWSAWVGDQDVTIEDIDADAFSGATLVRVRAGPACDFVLKSFPAGARARISRVHRFMMHLRSAGCREIPEVIATPGDETIVVDHSGGLWEAVRYVPGATTATPAPNQARAAATALGRIHAAGATWTAAPPRRAVPRSISQRIDQARRLAAEPWWSFAVREASDGSLVGPLQARLEAAVALARRPECVTTLRRIGALEPGAMPLQMVIRDVWSGHVVFAADDPARVAGIVDLHAAAIDTPATDLARLIGSWEGNPKVPLLDVHADAVAAYAAVRSLNPRERALVSWLDATGTIFALDNWFRWVFVEGRVFERPARVVGRVDRLLGKLKAAFEWLGSNDDAV